MSAAAAFLPLTGAIVGYLAAALAFGTFWLPGAFIMVFAFVVLAFVLLGSRAA